MGILDNSRKKDQEREVRFRQGISRIRTYLGECQQHRKRYWELAKRARSLDDQAQCALLIRRYQWTVEQMKLWERYLLQMETISLTREQVKATTTFSTYLAEFNGAMLAGASLPELSRLQQDLEQAIVRGHSLDETLNLAMDASSARVLKPSTGSAADPFKPPGDAPPEWSGNQGDQDSQISVLLRRLDEEISRS